MFGSKFDYTAQLDEQQGATGDRSVHSDEEDNEDIEEVEREGHKDIVFQGILVKEGGKFKTWNPRYFILYKDRLEYFASKTTPSASNAEKLLRGRILLQRGVQVGEAPERGITFCFKIITRTRCYYLVAQNDELVSVWTNHIRQILKTCNSSLLLSQRPPVSPLALETTGTRQHTVEHKTQATPQDEEEHMHLHLQILMQARELLAHISDDRLHNEINQMIANRQHSQEALQDFVPCHTNCSKEEDGDLFKIWIKGILILLDTFLCFSSNQMFGKEVKLVLPLSNLKNIHIKRQSYEDGLISLELELKNGEKHVFASFSDVSEQWQMVNSITTQLSRKGVQCDVVSTLPDQLAHHQPAPPPVPTPAPPLPSSTPLEDVDNVKKLESATESSEQQISKVNSSEQLTVIPLFIPPLKTLGEDEETDTFSDDEMSTISVLDRPLKTERNDNAQVGPTLAHYHQLEFKHRFKDLFLKMYPDKEDLTDDAIYQAYVMYYKIIRTGNETREKRRHTAIGMIYISDKHLWFSGSQFVHHPSICNTLSEKLCYYVANNVENIVQGKPSVWMIPFESVKSLFLCTQLIGKRKCESLEICLKNQERHMVVMLRSKNYFSNTEPIFKDRADVMSIDINREAMSERMRRLVGMTRFAYCTLNKIEQPQKYDSPLLYELRRFHVMPKKQWLSKELRKITQPEPSNHSNDSSTSSPYATGDDEQMSSSRRSTMDLDFLSSRIPFGIRDLLCIHNYFSGKRREAKGRIFGIADDSCIEVKSFKLQRIYPGNIHVPLELVVVQSNLNAAFGLNLIERKEESLLIHSAILVSQIESRIAESARTFLVKFVAGTHEREWIFELHKECISLINELYQQYVQEKLVRDISDDIMDQQPILIVQED